MSFQKTKPEFVTVFETKNEKIEILVYPPFNKVDFRNEILNHYSELMIKSRSKIAQQHAAEQFNQLNPLN